MTPNPNATPPSEPDGNTVQLIVGAIVTALFFGLMIAETIRLAMP